MDDEIYGEIVMVKKTQDAHQIAISEIGIKVLQLEKRLAQLQKKADEYRYSLGR